MKYSSIECSFDSSALRKRIEELSCSHKIVFLLSCAERLAPNYAAFTRHHSWGDFTVLLKALDFGWRYLYGEKLKRNEIEICLAQCEQQAPDTNEFDSEFVSPALDAAVCCSLLLKFLLYCEPELVIEGASLARDTVDMYVQEIDVMTPLDVDREQKILRHPMMRRELERQRKDLDFLERSDLTTDTVTELERRWRAPIRSNIDLLREE